MNTFLWSFYKCAGIAEVACVGVMDGDKILMGKRRDSGRWTNPGGHLEPGENPEEGAKRELFEEAGIKADKLEHLTSERVTTPKGKKIIVHAFRYNTSKTATTMKHDPDQEVSRWIWQPTPLSKEVLDNLHSPKNVLLKALGLQEMEKTALDPRVKWKTPRADSALGFGAGAAAGTSPYIVTRSQHDKRTAI